jgi:hypothetical protein
LLLLLLLLFVLLLFVLLLFVLLLFVYSNNNFKPHMASLVFQTCLSNILVTPKHSSAFSKSLTFLYNDTML